MTSDDLGALFGAAASGGSDSDGSAAGFGVWGHVDSGAATPDFAASDGAGAGSGALDSGEVNSADSGWADPPVWDDGGGTESEAEPDSEPDPEPDCVGPGAVASAEPDSGPSAAAESGSVDVGWADVGWADVGWADVGWAESGVAGVACRSEPFDGVSSSAVCCEPGPGNPTPPACAEPAADGPDGGSTVFDDPVGSLNAVVRPSAPDVEGRRPFDVDGAPSGDEPGRFIATVCPLDLDGGGAEGPECGQGPPGPA